MKRLNNEKGVALVMVLILSAIMLSIMAALVYMLTAATQMSGIEKRYKSTLEAAKGGSDIFYQIIGTRGGTADMTNWINTLVPSGSVVPVVGYELGTFGTCKGRPRGSAVDYFGMEAKLNTATATWTNCNTTTQIDTANNTTYDMKLTFGLGIGNNYNVYIKVVDTVEGNTGSDMGLTKSGVVNNTGEVTAVNQPYLYAIEVQSENTDTRERAKYSILYEY